LDKVVRARKNVVMMPTRGDPVVIRRSRRYRDNDAEEHHRGRMENSGSLVAQDVFKPLKVATLNRRLGRRARSIHDAYHQSDRATGGLPAPQLSA
jgi:hypothetical protein